MIWCWAPCEVIQGSWLRSGMDAPRFEAKLSQMTKIKTTMAVNKGAHC